MSEPLITVYCSTYNHAPYIKDALDGFVAQITDFPYVVIVHDDASTDGTTDIVLDYAARYPQIHPVIEKENQYSQGKSYFYDLFLPKLSSKYLARCEGDDYWTSPYKLQMQVSYLEQHESCVACVHDTLVFDLQRKTKAPLSMLSGEQDIAPSNLIGLSVPFHTSSVVCRSSVYSSYPPFLRSVPGVGDYPLRVYLATCGSVHYFDQVMSVYRRGVPGSWTVRRTRSSEKLIEDCGNIIRMLEMANEYSDRKYEREFLEAILEQKYAILDARGQHRDLLSPEYRNIFLHKRSRKHQFRILISALMHK